MDDIDHILTRLAQSAFRRRFVLSSADREYLARKGLDAVLDHARGFVRDRLAPAVPSRDGKQTPFRGHPVFVAQHATATCCRGCLAKWHGIAKGAPLDGPQQSYIVAVIERWLTPYVEDDNGPEEPRLL